MFLNEKKELEIPTGGNWVAFRRDIGKKHPIIIRNVHPISAFCEIFVMFPPRDIVSINENNPNKNTDIKIIQAAPDLWRACMIMENYFDALENGLEPDHKLDYCINMIRNAIKLANEGYPPSFHENLHRFQGQYPNSLPLIV